MSPPTLPPELLTNIISHVDADTLPATRLGSNPESQPTTQEVEEANVAAEALMAFYDRSKAMTNFLNSECHVELMSQAFKNLKPANVQVSLGFYDDTPQVIGQNKVLWAP
ncbi:hypothetical protein D6C78_05737 [Aureobasidium pullulans]|uniref:F-box domain-containing protein n=1 Tax=Aureobasidium pullulans TaxID=5580 RepID=A0A4T0BW74_AURPU|nr:hypothetical protein D6C78_05737 [Aureobasidium pullulans]